MARDKTDIFYLTSAVREQRGCRQGATLVAHVAVQAQPSLCVSTAVQNGGGAKFFSCSSAWTYTVDVPLKNSWTK